MANFEAKPFGKYFLTDRIAVGGMAEIYKAKTFGVDGFEKILAIKKILQHYSADKEFIMMLTDEAKLVVNLSHANIVQVYDLGRVGDDYFISMEFIDGINLRDVILRAQELKEKIPPEMAIFIISEVCKGLDYAHSKKDTSGNPLGIIHRDVSPQNILVSFEGEVKIVDFGIAKAAMNISQTNIGTLKGKVTYMAPEQAFGKPIDGRTDLFSCGIVFYELLSLKRLFIGESQMEILKKIRNTKVAPETLNGDVPDVIKPILARALAYSVKNRYQSAADMQVDLLRLLYSNYQDFSPKKLAKLMHDWFGKEIKERHLSQAEKTLGRQDTVLVSHTKANQVELVHASLETVDVNADTISPEQRLSPERFMTGKTDASGAHEKTEKTQKSVSHIHVKTPLSAWRFLLFLFVFLTVAGGLAYIGWHFFKPQDVTLRHRHKGEVHVATVDLLSNPSGATIILDGEILSETTPTQISDLVVGQKYALKITKEGFDDIETEITLTSETNDPLGFTLNKIIVEPQVIKPKEKEKDIPIVVPDKTIIEPVVSIPQTIPVHISANVEAEVLIDDQNHGTTPMTVSLKMGAHKIILRKVDHKSETKTLTLTEKSQEQNLSFNLKSTKPQPTQVVTPIKTKEPKTTIVVPVPEKNVSSNVSTTAKLRVDSNPRGAAVTVGGVPRGITPIVVGDLKKNVSTTVVVSKKGYQTWQRSMTLSRDKTEVNATLVTQ